ncbi:putative Inactive pancreatic lipase-related protein 1 [Hypsibius exemplaris]|uniref:Inactive pancreatic lipase-related protein 1 n=1 Tax=Hypsibius exemplaris TaxID=2072580 RepID=A0A1W0WIY4_HYPEX|nr:putative Inactive pancreatic lipase-related protein 1 [Hypsibius exemplaris]
MSVAKTLSAVLLVGVVSCVAGIKLVLNTRQNPILPTNVDISSAAGFASFKGSTFSASRPTKILIHGYVDNYNSVWWLQMTAALLQAEDVNVLRLDWAESYLMGYQQASVNIITVGAQVANSIQYLTSVYGISGSKFHVIGHSLGAHVAGAIGEALKNRSIQLDRITGLDPAGPGFDGAPGAAKLELTDARVVDTIMTNGGGLGSNLAEGHLNSIKGQNLITATQCPEYDTFQQGQCTGQPRAIVGYRANLTAAGSSPLKFYS